MRTNVEQWKQLQDEGYFENHVCYDGLKEYGGEESVAAIERFMPLTSDMKVVVIGCGYGRETLNIAPRVRTVYGIDVNMTILDKASRFLGERGISNFVPVPYDEFEQRIPQGIDLVFSIVVMQHLTRDLVRDYFLRLGRKLAPGGAFVVQFLEALYDGVDEADAALIAQEPSVSWKSRQLVELSQSAGLTFGQIQTTLVTPTALWHWTHFRKA